MKRFVMNDYELLYLIKGNNDHIALEYMVSKYERFIWKKISHFHPKKSEYDDFFQEGLLMLYKAIISYNPNLGVMFYQYFDLILRRHFSYLLTKVPKYLLLEDANAIKDSSYDTKIIIEDNICGLTKKEELIYDLYFKKQASIGYIVNEFKMSKKQVYNTIYRIKQKARNY